MERKHKGGTEKLREKMKFALQANAAKYSKITDMFATAEPSSVSVADDCGGGGDAGSGSGIYSGQEHVVEPAVSWTAFRTIRLCNRLKQPNLLVNLIK